MTPWRPLGSYLTVTKPFWPGEILYESQFTEIAEFVLVTVVIETSLLEGLCKQNCWYEESLAERLLVSYHAFGLARLNDIMADIDSTPRAKSR